MRHQWYDPARGAFGREPGFVCCRMAQALSDPPHLGNDRSVLYVIEGRPHE